MNQSRLSQANPGVELIGPSAGSIEDEQATRPQPAKPDVQLIVVLLGSAMLVSALIAYQLFETPQQPVLMAMLAAVLLGAPVTINTIRGLFGSNRQDQHTEELVMLAFLASFASSRYVEAASIALFMYVASLIVNRTAAGARSTIEALMRVSPKRATRLVDGVEEDVLATELQAGDHVIVRPGDQVPCDGRVISGFSSLDEKYITGESHPVDKTEDDGVFAGSINLTGLLTVEVEKPLAESTLGRVQALILDAANQKTPVAQMLDRFSGYYTPVILGLAGIVLFMSKDISLVISLLLIACPMEIIISGPLATVAALTAAARLGVLIKNVPDIEVAHKLSAIVFDKTGTLTTGNLAVTRLHPVEGVDPAELLHLAASLEQYSRHPVAKAVTAVAERAKVGLSEVQDFEEAAGRGVRGTLHGRTVLAGREAWVRDAGIDLPPDLLDEAGSMSVLLLAENNRCIGWLGLADQTRDGAPDVLDDLHDLGIHQRIMVTGDRRGPAERVASQLDLTGMVAEALPGDKLDIVRQLKQRGHTVAVIGDGVNDGPALAAADLSIAMGAAGSDVAINAASVALMNSQLNRLPFLVRLSKATNRVIRQNIGFVLCYILTMVALLTFGFITPLVAAIAHGVSSIVVVFNSARLIREGEDLPQTESLERLRAAQSPQSASRLERIPALDPAPTRDSDPVIGPIPG
ncbi:MAG: cation-translocating P-type ATPase [Planctomycetota bacterium]